MSKKKIKERKKLRKTKELKRIFDDFKNVDGIDSIAIMGRDGLLDLKEGSSGKSLVACVAMVATMVGAAEEAFKEIDYGIPKLLFAENENFRVVATPLNSKFLLLTTSRATMHLNLMLVEVERAAEKIKEILE